MKSGRVAQLSGARIAGIVSCVPPKVVTNDHFASQFGDGVAEVTKMTGVLSRHWVEPDVTTSDLCAAAAERLLTGLGWDADSLDALIFISQTPDHRLPATASILQARLGARPGIIAFDVNLGCSAYPYGLWLAMMMVQAGAARRVLLAVGDTSSRVVDPSDRATALLFGDAGTATAIEANELCEPVTFILGSDGRGAENLMIPQGAFRSIQHRSPNDPEKLFMDGGEIFTFTLKSVPPLVADSLDSAGERIETVDYFLFHQANTFMIKHLAKKSKIPLEKVPINIDRYGNTSSATIPLLLSDDLSTQLRQGSLNVGMFGFGVGYSWASAIARVGPLACVETISL